MTTENNKHLFRLDELSDYKVASDDPDVRGWKVQDTSGKIIGKVDNLLVNKNTEKVVYLDIEVDKSIIDANYQPYGQSANEGVHEFINKDGENHLILPIGMASLNNSDHLVNTDKVDYETFAKTKRYKKGTPVNREYEIVVMDHYNKETIDHKPGDAFYERNEFERRNA